MAKKAEKSLEEMSLAELEALAAQLADDYRQLGQARRKVAAALGARQSERAARDRLAAMPEAERAALAQLLKADGIESGEQFGKPGG